ncbi:PAS domain S-box protein [Parasedimentitalea maritima]|uniref:PAS domain S-box protein n=1 Tax=Parasedimentitalea maritima TaxID=2578117 RepID=A0ABY2UP40_9RHOB|nr:PAS domain S-box protein [Zongyanglinia marina]
MTASPCQGGFATIQQKDLVLAEVTDLSNAIHSAAIVTIADSDGKIIQTNHHFTEISGYTEAEVLGREHSVLSSDHHREEYFADLWSTIKKGKVWRSEICNKVKNGSKLRGWRPATLTYH